MISSGNLRIGEIPDALLILWTESGTLTNLGGSGEVLSCPSHERTWSNWLPSEIGWLAKQIRPLLHWHIASFLCITVGSLLALLTPLVLKWLIDRIIPQRRMGLLLLAVALIFVAHQGRAMLNSFGTYLMLSAAQKMGLSLRMNVLRHLDTLSADYYENTPVGVVMYPLKEPIEEISYFGSDLLPAILQIFLTSGLTLATMFVLSPILTLVIVPLIPIFLLTRQRLRKKIAIEADRVQRDRLQWNDSLQEHLSSMISIQLLGQEERQERRLFLRLARAVRSQQNLYKSGIWFTARSSMAIVLAMCAVIAYGGVRVLAGALSIGSLVAFYGFIAQLFDPLSGAADLYTRAQRTFASVRQVQSALAVGRTTAKTGSNVYIAKQSPLQLDFHDVEFRYARQKQLLQIPHLQIVPGEHMAIAGENGAGKSTLAKLMVRLYEPAFGVILLGGEDIRNIHSKSLRRNVFYLQRDPVLFDGTVASNLRFIRPCASDAELQEVLHYVGLTELIASFPDGLRQRIGPGACQLSGGERQRLAIARAILQAPGVLILDEATSCIDPSTEIFIFQNIRRKLPSSTCMVISHRPATCSRFSRVLLLSRGRIVHDGGLDASRLAQITWPGPSIPTA